MLPTISYLGVGSYIFYVQCYSCTFFTSDIATVYSNREVRLREYCLQYTIIFYPVSSCAYPLFWCTCMAIDLNSGEFLPDIMCVWVCCHPIYSGRQTCGRTSRGHTGGISHRIYPPSFCGACLNIYREKDTAVPLSRRP